MKTKPAEERPSSPRGGAAGHPCPRRRCLRLLPVAAAVAAAAASLVSIGGTVASASASHSHASSRTRPRRPFGRRTREGRGAVAAAFAAPPASSSSSTTATVADGRAVAPPSFPRDRRRRRRAGTFPPSLALASRPDLRLGAAPTSATPEALASLISPSDDWGNVAALSLAASVAQILGRTTKIGKLLGGPVTAMALTFALSSVGFVPARIGRGWKFQTLLPPGGSSAASFLQRTSLSLATPLLLLGTGLRGAALRRCGALLGSFALASFGTLVGSIVALSLPGVRGGLEASLGGDGLKVAAALLAKNVGGGINYVAVCSCLNASAEAIAAGLCVDNVMALAYFPLVSFLASRYGDVDDDDDDSSAVEEEEVQSSDASVRSNEWDGGDVDETSPIEALSHAFTLAALATVMGRILNAKLARGPGAPNLSLPISTLLAVLFSTYYPPDAFLSPTTKISKEDGNDVKGNAIAQAGETLGTSLLYLFFATAGAPGWRTKDSVRSSFPPLASFLIGLYGIHGLILWGAKRIVDNAGAPTPDEDDDDEGASRNGGSDAPSYWTKAAAPQRLLAASSAAIGGPATAVALARSFRWTKLASPSLLVGNFGYAVATFLGLAFYGAFKR